MKKIVFLLLGATLILFIIIKLKQSNNTQVPINNTSVSKNSETFPLQITEMRGKSYSGSEIKIEEELSPNANYKQYLTSYLSDGLKIYALLTIPTSEKPQGGYPAIIFNHGYIPPEQYRTTERYVGYIDGFARSGYIVFKPDYRGHGNSEGKPEGAYYSPAYTTDVLNAVASIEKLNNVNPNKIGMWGHSLGGNITMRSMVVSKKIKAGVIWSGVVGTYDDMLTRWTRTTPFRPSPREAQNHVRSIRQELIAKYGAPEENHEFWKSIDPHNFFDEISGPIQLHHGLSDEEVPLLFSQSLYNDLKKINKTVELYTYEGADHNLSQGFNLAMQRSVDFFDKYLK